MNMKQTYKKEVKEAFGRISQFPASLITEDDLRPLPVIVQKYLRITGVPGTEKVWNFRVEMEGNIRGKPTDNWMRLSSVQYNFIDDPARIFYIKAKKMGIPVVGLHLYKNETASMQIKLAGLFTVADARGPEMNQGETVTVFNDMCFMAPATLISKNIKWEILDLYTVKAYFTNGNITISAVLYFNEEGKLVNFISNDRFETTDGKSYKNYPWLTPVKEFREINGRMMPARAEAIYQYPDREFCYAEFEIKDVRMNCAYY
jgi:hypothetical protein